jgi:hypothetical protein
MKIHFLRERVDHSIPLNFRFNTQSMVSVCSVTFLSFILPILASQ